jgi:hypothetical protein
MTLMLLLAQSENPVTSISRHLQKSEGLTARDLVIFGMVGAAVALVTLLLAFAGRMVKWWTRHSAPRLFRELCAVHKLSAKKRQLLYQLVRAHQMTDLALIFAMPERFDAQNLPARIRHRAAEIASLREDLFGISA